MKAHLRKHIVYYIAFSLVQLLGLVLVLKAAGDEELQMIAIFATTVFYFAFAIMHHILDHDLTKKIVIEYALALIGCLGLAVSLFLFTR
jgi:hypothetical protein